MKKLFLMLIATVCVAGAYAQNMQIWTEDDIMYEQSVTSIDSITFTQSNVPEQEETLYKTWEEIKSVQGVTVGIRIILSQDNTFSYYYGQIRTISETDDLVWTNFGSGTFLRQGKLILMCLTSGEGVFLPTCLVYHNGKLYGGFGLAGSFELQ